MNQKNNQILQYLNLARQKPSHYLALVENQINLFQNQFEIIIQPEIRYQTNEGKAAWIQAKQFLKNISPLHPLKPNQALTFLSQHHIDDMCTNNIYGHIGSDSSTFKERLQRYCMKGIGQMSEVIGADFCLQKRNIPEMLILGLIIDDGVKNRGHRNAIYNKNYEYAGVSTGIQNQKVLGVINLSEQNIQLKSGISISKVTKEDDKKLNFKIIQVHHKKQNPQQTQNNRKLQKQSKKLQKQNDKKTQINQKNSQNQKNLQKNQQITIYKLPTLTNISNLKRILEKKQFIKNIYENGYKISQLRTMIKYQDGSIQQNTQRLTSYLG